MKRSLIFLLLILSAVSCISPRKYTRLEAAYKVCKADSAQYKGLFEKYKEESNRYQSANIRLMQDTMRLYKNYLELSKKYDELQSVGFQEAARVSRQLSESKKRYSLSMPAKNRAEVLMTGMNNAVGAVRESLVAGVAKYNSSGVKVSQEEWNLIVSINDSLFFRGGVLSAEGRDVVNTVIETLKDKKTFDVIVRERIPATALTVQQKVAFSTELPYKTIEKVVEKKIIDERDSFSVRLSLVDTIRTNKVSVIKPEAQKVVAVDTVSSEPAPIPEKRGFSVPVPFSHSNLLLRAFEERKKNRYSGDVMILRMIDPTIDRRKIEGVVDIILIPKVKELHKLIKEEATKNNGEASV